MEPTASQLLMAIHAASDEITALRGAQLTRQDVTEAIKEGIRSATSDPEVWSGTILAIQAHARAEAGGWLFGGIRAVLSKIGWILLVGGAVYLIGGWAGLAALWKAGMRP